MRTTEKSETRPRRKGTLRFGMQCAGLLGSDLRLAAFFAVCAVLLPAWVSCSDDSTTTNLPDATPPDALGRDRAVDAAPDALVPDAFVPDGAPGCKPAVTDPPILGHAGGQDCFSCHDNMGADLRWTIAGTAYLDQAGTGPLGGATVTVVDQQGKVLDLVTGSNGNFYTNQPVTFPLTVVVSKCPDLLEMPEPLASHQGCNTCHDATNRVHLP